MSEIVNDPIEDILDLGRAMWSEGRFNDHPYDENYLREFIVSAMDDGFVMVIPDVGFFIGGATTFWFDPTQLQAFDLAWYVKPEYRHKTYGIRLLKGFIAWAQVKGCKEIVISPQVEIDNSSCERLLESEGFKPLGRAMVKSCTN